MNDDVLMLSGSLTQSVLQRNLSHASQPIGGVRASPFSSEVVIKVFTKAFLDYIFT
jgi:hypothetical protein